MTRVQIPFAELFSYLNDFLKAQNMLDIFILIQIYNTWMLACI